MMFQVPKYSLVKHPYELYPLRATEDKKFAVVEISGTQHKVAVVSEILSIYDVHTYYFVCIRMISS
jgi:hypothetical protein